MKGRVSSLFDEFCLEEKGGGRELYRPAYGAKAKCMDSAVLRCLIFDQPQYFLDACISPELSRPQPDKPKPGDPPPPGRKGI